MNDDYKALEIEFYEIMKEETQATDEDKEFTAKLRNLIHNNGERIRIDSCTPLPTNNPA